MRSLNFVALAIAGISLAGISAAAAPPQGEGFVSARAAAKALLDAATGDDVDRLVAILGPSSKEILVTSDPIADQKVRRKFATAAGVRMKLVADPRLANAKTLLVGKDDWPLPIPIVSRNGKWYFDLDQGKQEILARRIGANELDAIDICRGYVEAQDDYADGAHGIPHYADRIISSPGKRDGLYWPASNPSEQSPIGEVISRAFAEGYTKKGEPYHGYYFKILTAQGAHAPGGEFSYLNHGLMTKGFALIAWPSDYGSTGVMTFIVDKTGIVYQKNLGPATAEIARSYNAYDPDQTWAPVTTSARR